MLQRGRCLLGPGSAPHRYALRCVRDTSEEDASLAMTEVRAYPGILTGSVSYPLMKLE
ncbi:hypothetical protein ABH973_001121 [Bradyrhizobium ottawaense]